MSVFLGFNSNRIVTILVGALGIFLSTKLDGEGFLSFIRYSILALSVLTIALVLVIIGYEFFKYLSHYRKFMHLKDNWDTELLKEHLSNLEKHYDNYLVKRISFYIPYRNMIEEIKTVLERS